MADLSSPSNLFTAEDSNQISEYHNQGLEERLDIEDSQLELETETQDQEILEENSQQILEENSQQISDQLEKEETEDKEEEKDDDKFEEKEEEKEEDKFEEKEEKEEDKFEEKEEDKDEDKDEEKEQEPDQKEEKEQDHQQEAQTNKEIVNVDSTLSERLSIPTRGMFRRKKTSSGPVRKWEKKWIQLGHLRLFKWSPEKGIHPYFLKESEKEKEEKEKEKEALKRGGASDNAPVTRSHTARGQKRKNEEIEEDSENDLNPTKKKKEEQPVLRRSRRERKEVTELDTENSVPVDMETSSSINSTPSNVLNTVDESSKDVE